MKHDSAFVVWPLYVYKWGVRRGVLAMLASVLVFLVSFFPYVPEGSEGILRNVFLYRAITAPYGLMPLHLWFHTPLMLLAVLVAPALVRKLPLNEALLICVLVWLVTTSGIGIQYFLLPLMIGALDAQRHWGWLLALGLVVAYIEINFMIPGAWVSFPLLRLAWASLWLIVTTWLISLTILRAYNLRAVPRFFLRR